MSSPSIFEQAYRSAIALNNCGVALLERQCYKQALDTTRDAMAMLRISFQRASTSGPNNASMFFDDPDHISGNFLEDSSQLVRIQRCTHNASLRFANPQRYHSGSDGPVTKICVRSFSTSDYDKPSSVFMHHSYEGTSSETQSVNIICPIRCDDIDNEVCFDDNMDTTCLEMKAAILLHNFALVHFCMSKVTGTPVHSSLAQELLLMSHKTMKRLTSRSHDGFFVVELRIISLAITVAQSLLFVLQEPRQSCMTPSEIRELQEHLHNLQTTVQGTCWDEGLFITAAAA